MENNERLMPGGLRFFNPADAAPDFVMGTLLITPKKLVEYIKANPDLLRDHEGDKQLKVQLLLSKGGKLYGKVDDYKKDAEPVGKKPPRPGAAAATARESKAPEELDDDMPF